MQTGLTTLSRWRHGFESRWGCYKTPGQRHSPECLFLYPSPVANEIQVFIHCAVVQFRFMLDGVTPVGG